MRFTKVGNDNKAKMEPQKQKSEGQNVFIMILKNPGNTSFAMIVCIFFDIEDQYQ